MKMSISQNNTTTKNKQTCIYLLMSFSIIIRHHQGSIQGSSRVSGENDWHKIYENKSIKDNYLPLKYACFIDFLLIVYTLKVVLNARYVKPLTHLPNLHTKSAKIQADYYDSVCNCKTYNTSQYCNTSQYWAQVSSIHSSSIVHRLCLHTVQYMQCICGHTNMYVWQNTEHCTKKEKIVFISSWDSSGKRCHYIYLFSPEYILQFRVFKCSFSFQFYAHWSEPQDQFTLKRQPNSENKSIYRIWLW